MVISFRLILRHKTDRDSREILDIPFKGYFMLALDPAYRDDGVEVTNLEKEIFPDGIRYTRTQRYRIWCITTKCYIVTF